MMGLPVSNRTSSLIFFTSSLATDVTGFVAVDTTNNLIVVSFRGSVSVRNWLTDVDFPTVSTTICSTCVAADGFWTSWLEAQSKVLAAVNTGRAQHPTFKVVVTGHSLGGAIASLAAGVLRSKGINADLVSIPIAYQAVLVLTGYSTPTVRPRLASPL